MILFCLGKCCQILFFNERKQKTLRSSKIWRSWFNFVLASMVRLFIFFKIIHNSTNLCKQYLPDFLIFFSNSTTVVLGEVARFQWYSEIFFCFEIYFYISTSFVLIDVNIRCFFDRSRHIFILFWNLVP